MPPSDLRWTVGDSCRIRTSRYCKSGGELEELLALQNGAVDAAVLSEPIATVALRSGSSLLFDLSHFAVPYSMHGFGTRRSFLRQNRDTVVRFMKAYLEGIFLFKTNKELALNVLKKYTRVDDISVMLTAYDEYSQRYIPAVPYPSPAGIQTILDQLAKTRPQVKKFAPNELIDGSVLEEIEQSVSSSSSTASSPRCFCLCPFVNWLAVSVAR